MKLHWSPRSPFVRKVMITLHERGLLECVTCVRSVVIYSAPPNPEVLRDNPLGKIPTLITDDGQVLFDSSVICAYLDGLDGAPVLVPADPQARIRQLRWEALGDGLTELLLMWRIERRRPDGPYDVHLASFEAKVRRCFAVLEDEAPALAEVPFGIGQIAVICALGQLEFRYQGCGWELAFPGLAAWYGLLRDRPSVAATEVEDDSADDPALSLSPFVF